MKRKQVIFTISLALLPKLHRSELLVAFSRCTYIPDNGYSVFLIKAEILDQLTAAKDLILQDLNTTLTFIKQFGESQTACDEINNFIEQPDSIVLEHKYDAADYAEKDTEGSNKLTDSIHENSLVYISSPEIKGIVISLKKLGDTTQYNVFVNNAVKQYYSGQIALVEQTTEKMD